jgi:hypothetical protein
MVENSILEPRVPVMLGIRNLLAELHQSGILLNDRITDQP